MSAPLRPAEEIAREMVAPCMQNRITGKAVVALLCGGSRVYVEVDSDGEADDLRRLIARLVERRDTEHAVAERNKQTERPHAAGIVEGLRKARSIVFATVSGEIKDEVNRGIDEAIDEATARIPAAAQPNDLAGRIRGVSGDDVLCAAQRNGVQGCGPDKLLFSREAYDDPPEEQEARIRAAETRAADEFEAIVRDEVNP